MSRFDVLGTKVDAVQIQGVVKTIREWIAAREGSKFIAVTGMHGVMEARQSATFHQVLAKAALVVPDGMPLVWVGRCNGFNMPRRVYGPDLMEAFLAETSGQYRHFFYGGAEGVAERLAETLRGRFGIQVAGTWCPPFRPLTPAEENDVAAMIEDARPDIVWVGMSTPKQETWMAAHSHLDAPVMIGVGAAFDFFIGRVPQAPAWMRENGLEWLFRLLSEPRRLWRRYLILGGKFGWHVSWQMIRLRFAPK